MITFFYKDFTKTRRGGAVTAGIKLANSLEENGIDIKKVSYSKEHFNFRFFIELFTKRESVIWNISTKSLPIFFIFILISFLSKKKVIVRFFGDDQQTLYRNSKLYSFFFNTLNKYNIYFLFETKTNTVYFKRKLNRVIHFPNFINTSSYLKTSPPSNKKVKLVYVGLISYEKGTDILLELLYRNKDIKVDIFGKIDNRFTLPKHYNSIFNNAYKGLLEWSEVPQILAKYHLLILPSRKEGYPSIVLESLATGLPMILNNLPSLKEMVNESAIFIEPNVDSLESAINSIDLNKWEIMSNATKNEIIPFKEENVIKNIINIIK